MKLMVYWQLHPEKRHDVFGAFGGMDLADYQSQQGSTINVIGRWHDVAGGTGVAICETDDAEAFSAWLLAWISVCDFEMAPVLTDEEAHSVCRKAFSEA